jgi:hypothetical protein
MTPEEKETLRGILEEFRAYIAGVDNCEAWPPCFLRLEAMLDTKVELPDPGTFVACLEEATQGNTDNPHWVEWFDPESNHFLIDTNEVSWCLQDIGKWTEIGEYECRPLLRRISAIKLKTAIGTEVEYTEPFRLQDLKGVARYVVDYALGSGNEKWLNFIEAGVSANGLLSACEGIYDPVVAVKAVARVHDLPVPIHLSHKDFLK